mgnify:FL=1
MIFYLLLFIVIIITCKHIYEIHNFNHMGILEQLQSPNKEEIFQKLQNRNPLLIHNLGNKNNILKDLSFDNLIKDNPGHIINHNNKYISLKYFGNNEIQNMNIYKNKDLYKQFNLQNVFDIIYEPFYSQLHCNKNYYMSLLKGKNDTSLIQNKHNISLIYQLLGESVIYIFNPKHKNDIIHKENNEIKKYAYKLNLSKGLVVYIPVEWYYFFETENESIIGEIECDNYFTSIYNNLR